MKSIFLLLVVIAVTSTVIAVHESPQFNTLIQRIINNFEDVARSQGGRQFAVLLFVAHNEVNNWEVPFQPANPDGGPLLDLANVISPSDHVDYGNFLVARPDRTTQPTTHSEQQLLDDANLQALLDAFRAIHGPSANPAAVILYTRIIPCVTCTDLIINALNQPPYINADRAVLFTTQGRNIRNLNPEYTNRILRENDIVIREYRYPEFNCPVPQLTARPTRDHSIEEFHRTVQEELLHQLREVAGGCAGSDKGEVAAADFINRLMNLCSSALGDTDDFATCMERKTGALVGNACGHFTPHGLAASVRQHVTNMFADSQGVLYYVGEPLMELTEETCPIKQVSDLADLVTISYECKDTRQEGLLCSHWKPEYVTAGNSICQEHHPCRRYEYYDLWELKYYDWCNIEVTKAYDWEYCCTDTCTIHADSSYSYCHSGTTYEYCARYSDNNGLKDVKGHNCLHTFPCGKHGSYSGKYWCYYTHGGSWDYCCAPGQTCGYHDETYKWCYTADNEGRWDYC